jgi:hypothetical protein
MIVTYDRQNMFIIQAIGFILKTSFSLYVEFQGNVFNANIKELFVWPAVVA